jgi:hypothetical protein
MRSRRRDFLRRAGQAGAVIAGDRLGFGQAPRRTAVSLVRDPADDVASAPPSRWALAQLEAAMTHAGMAVRQRENVRQAGADEICIVASGSSTPAAVSALKSAHVEAPAGPESLAILNARMDGRGALLACGADVRGLVYAVSELADRVRFAPVPRAALEIPHSIVERPANPVRSIMRQFTSEVLDKPWFYDREQWTHYLDMLATQRFNRFHLAFGLGYDSLQQVADSYFLFLYPFLLTVPGYRVRVTNLPDQERDRNLETLRFISEETVARGIDFQLGLWMHGYRWPNSPRARYTIEGLTDETHASYCRDAATALLQACPAVSSVAIRIHGESGIAEGSYSFWSAVFDGVKRCGRKVELDLHAKGIDNTMIDAALATGLPVNLAPKYWAEHLGMPYHQASNRELEMPVPGHTGAGLMTLSEGSRVATRYGYADLLRDDRQYTVRHRIFSGTQRILLWGDPASAAAYSRMFQFCGSTGVDVMEPLTCRGRRGTGVPGSRTGYSDAHLEPRWDWEKYAYWYRVWGRLLYNPETAPEVWQRQFGSGAQARALEVGLANASRILPIVTTTHMPSAACDAYWPEIYWNQPMAGEPRPNPYSDTPAPKTFQNTSPLDPQLFSRMTDCAAEQWLEDLAARAEKALADAGKPASVEAARAAIDVDMQAALGRFFAAKFRGGVLYSMYERTGGRAPLEQALKCYRTARAMWVRLVDRANGIYAADLSASDKISERGQWQDRLTAIDADIAQLEQHLATAKDSDSERTAAAVAEALGRPQRNIVDCKHNVPAGFAPKQAVRLEFSIAPQAEPMTATLHYRHVNQTERYRSVEMELRGRGFQASIPAEYTDSPYPLQYYVEFRQAQQKASLYPGFEVDPLNQPYFVLRRS